MRIGAGVSILALRLLGIMRQDQNFDHRAGLARNLNVSKFSKSLTRTTRFLLLHMSQFLAARWRNYHGS